MVLSVALFKPFDASNPPPVPRRHVHPLRSSEKKTHFDIGFQLTQFPGKVVLEPKGEKVGALEVFNTMFTCLQWRVSRGARRTTEERFKGGSMRTAMNQKAEKEGNSL